MKHLSLSALSLTSLLLSCAVDDPVDDPVDDLVEQPAGEPTEAVHAAAVGGGGDKCAPDLCGMNSPELGDGYFHELNLDGAVSPDGWSLLGYGAKGSALYAPSVSGGRMTATLIYGAPGTPETLRGGGLVGLRFRIRKTFATGAVTITFVIEATGRAGYWAKLPGGGTPPVIETYKFRLDYDNGTSTYMCRNGGEFLDPSSPVRGMLEHHAVLFEGDRINVEHLSVASISDPRWINIGCAETALAKMHLTGHTRAALADGFSTTSAERQTMLKMLTADYCGTGTSFTVAGQRLRWSDDHGTMRLPADEPRALEAAWGPSGAVCLNTPRVQAHPTAASREAFPFGVSFLVGLQCPKPSCNNVLPIQHLRSWNPLPYTN